MGELELSKLQGSRRQGDLIGAGGFESSHLFPPRKRFPPPGQLCRFSHDSAGSGVSRVQLQKLSSYQDGALIIGAREEILRLARQALFAQDAVSAVGREDDCHHHETRHEPPRPSLIKVAALERADIAETVLTF